jgi:hypothetical protein
MPAQHFGKYSGVVRSNVDEQMLGRLQVAVPAIFPEEEQVIARPALPYGFFFVPEIGAKVWVEFEGGDTTKPLWTGVQYVQGEWPPEAAGSPPQKRVMKTAGGHLVIFDDTPGAASIEIKDGMGGHTVKLDVAAITLEHGLTGAKIEIGPGGITIDGVTAVNLSANAALPVLRVSDQGIGNLGAPVVITGPGNPLVRA